MVDIYLDSCILIAYYASDKTEVDKKKLVLNAFKVFSELKDVRLVTSHWALAEMVNVLVSNKSMKSEDVAVIESSLVNEKRIEGLKIYFLDVSNDRNYDYPEFFYNVRKGILQYHSGVGDTIHSVIMKNNEVKQILTFDEKRDFKVIPDLTVLHPRDINL